MKVISKPKFIPLNIIQTPSNYFEFLESSEEKLYINESISEVELNHEKEIFK